MQEDEPVELPVTGDLDLHAFDPRDIPSVVEEYVRACRERGIMRRMGADAQPTTAVTRSATT